MRIECPACHTAYEVPEQKLPGRQLRCVSCRHQWIAVVALSEPATAATAPASPAPLSLASSAPLAIPPEIARAPVSHPPKPRRPAPWLALGWAASILICGAGTYAAFALRSPVMHAWPPSIRFYHALHLDSASLR